MKFEKCLTCEQCGSGCRPDFMSMTTSDLLDWIDRYQKLHGITNVALAQMSGVPKGTIDGIKARKRADIRHETLRPIISALIGDTEELCKTPLEQQNSKIPELEAEIDRLKHDLQLAEKLEHISEKNADRIDRVLRVRSTFMYILMALCSVLVATLVGYLRMDVRNPDIGLVQHTGVSPLIIVVVAAIAMFFGVAVAYGIKVINKLRKKDDKIE